MTHRPSSGRVLLLVVALALVGAACGGTSTPEATTTTGGGAAATTTTAAADPAAGGRVAPDFSLALSDGTTFSLAAEEKPVCLVFWAEWCPICAQEMPVVDQVAGDYLDDVTFVAVAGRSSYDLTAERAGEWFSGNLPWGLDDSIWDLYGINAQPVAVLISPDDVIVDQWYGILPDPQIRERLDTALATG
jgi:thiol-disulfide isomerase/thioredoxin